LGMKNPPKGSWVEGLVPWLWIQSLRGEWVKRTVT
jgi:hypothetical protein